MTLPTLATVCWQSVSPTPTCSPLAILRAPSNCSISQIQVRAFAVYNDERQCMVLVKGNSEPRPHLSGLETSMQYLVSLSTVPPPMYFAFFCSYNIILER